MFVENNMFYRCGENLGEQTGIGEEVPNDPTFGDVPEPGVPDCCTCDDDTECDTCGSADFCGPNDTCDKEEDCEPVTFTPDPALEETLNKDEQSDIDGMVQLGNYRERGIIFERPRVRFRDMLEQFNQLKGNADQLAEVMSLLIQDGRDFGYAADLIRANLESAQTAAETILDTPVDGD